jgi:hypothetical protein
MSRTLTDLLSSIPTDEGRNEVLDLGRQVHEAGDSGRMVPGGPDQQELLQTMSDRILWHMRAARFALPRPEELLRMIDEHFAPSTKSR